MPAIIKAVGEDGRRQDAALARAAAQGDPNARRKLVERLLDRVALCVRYIAGGSPDRDDYVQLAIMKILQSAGTFRGDSSLETWSEKITVRLVLRQLKKHRWRAQFMAYNSSVEPSAENLSGESSMTRKQISERLAVVLFALPEKRRLVVTLRLVLGHSIEEITEMTGLNENTVRDRIAIGRKQLRQQIRRDPLLCEHLKTL